jgi:hypothetical protein
MISPFWYGSKPLMQRSSVLLPEPLGPQMTTVWPFSMVSSMS